MRSKFYYKKLFLHEFLHNFFGLVNLSLKNFAENFEPEKNRLNDERMALFSHLGTLEFLAFAEHQL